MLTKRFQTTTILSITTSLPPAANFYYYFLYSHFSKWIKISFAASLHPELISFVKTFSWWPPSWHVQYVPRGSVSFQMVYMDSGSCLSMRTVSRYLIQYGYSFEVPLEKKINNWIHRETKACFVPRVFHVRFDLMRAATSICFCKNVHISVMFQETIRLMLNSLECWNSLDIKVLKHPNGMRSGAQSQKQKNGRTHPKYTVSKCCAGLEDIKKRIIDFL